MTWLIVFFCTFVSSPMILDKNTKCSGGNKTEAIEKLLAAGAEAGAESGGELKH